MTIDKEKIVKKLKSHFQYIGCEVNDVYVFDKKSMKHIHTFTFKTKHAFCSLMIQEFHNNLAKIEVSVSVADSLIQQKIVALDIVHQKNVDRFVAMCKRISLVNIQNHVDFIKDMFVMSLKRIHEFDHFIENYFNEASKQEEFVALLNKKVMDVLKDKEGVKSYGNYYFYDSSLFECVLTNDKRTHDSYISQMSKKLAGYRRKNWFSRFDKETIPYEGINMETVMTTARLAGKTIRNPNKQHWRGKGDKVAYEYVLIQDNARKSSVRSAYQKMDNKKVRHQSKQMLHQYVVNDDENMLISHKPDKWWD